jgi:hypothetical protein
LSLFKLPRTKSIKTELLFLERCLDLLAPGGRMGIVLPEGIFNNPSLAHVREFTEDRAFLRAVVSLPQETFTSSGASVKCSVLFIDKFSEEEAARFEQTRDANIAEITAKNQPEVDSTHGRIDRAFAGQWSQTDRWNPGSFQELDWQWPDNIIQPLSSALTRRVESVDREAYPLEALTFGSLHFGGDLSLRDMSSKPAASPPTLSQIPTISPGRYALHPRDMTPEERFELITDIFAEAFIEIRLAEIIADSRRGHDDNSPCRYRPDQETVSFRAAPDYQ